MFCSNANSGSWIIILILILWFAGGNTTFCGNQNRCAYTPVCRNENTGCNTACC